MNEDEAKRKFCPFKLSISNYDNDHPILNNMFCEGSACMGWSLDEDPVRVSTSHIQDMQLQKLGYKFDYSVGNAKYFVKTENLTGHCGMKR